MKRTREDAARRRQIADAAAGLPPVHVVLYACVPPSHDAETTVRGLHRYAQARDWTPAAVLLDHSPHATPVELREQWTRVVQMIERREASGIVTPVRSMCGYTDTERRQIDTWLRAHGAFLAVSTRAGQVLAPPAETGR
ncbi:hypothetical protein JJV70_02475 [Streptomyces sp. JJ66]|uniref:hypothetical protein n=1 Tax=Streptomyces sp. JJ66 TaxID=2803843 RepID=UPI001C567218|nr:hypothetical protein [Streptomyces sp. JJ66]MBW1600987.1 hypothetical protein [Streptomyces sp. JJ66]